MPLYACHMAQEWQRVVLWSFWALNMLVNIIYIGMSFATSARLSSVGAAAALQLLLTHACMHACIVHACMHACQLHACIVHRACM